MTTLRRSMMCAMMLAVAGVVHAQPNKMQPLPDKTADIIRNVGYDQRLNAQVPLNLTFRDETGRSVRLSDYVHDKPVVLILAYYKCPMLCTEVLNGALKAMRALSFDLGKEYEAITVSIDPSETPQLATEKRASYIKSYDRPGGADGWHFLTGEQESIDALAKTVGFRYVYDPGSGQYAHAAGLVVLTPTGRVARYLLNVEFAPKDLKFALMEASDNKIGSIVDQALFLCFHYDPSDGKYGFVVMGSLRIVGGLFLLTAGVAWFIWRRNDRRKRAARQAQPAV